MPNNKNRGLYIVLISAHGLLRSTDMELGRDADTGGQIKYVVELAKTLAEDTRVSKVDLFTRLVIDNKVSSDYANEIETISENCKIVRLEFGPQRYLRKELIWPYLDTMADKALQNIRRVGEIPDIIHSHYADAGYVGARLSALLGVPLIHTGHSLGRVKRQRLLQQGISEAVIENEYNISRRIEAEEFTLENAALVIASTRQEVEQQYGIYDHYQPQRMNVIPPGVDLEKFHPPEKDWQVTNIQQVIQRFLRFPDRPIILALSRPDVRKNIARLVEAYGNSQALRDTANLVIIAGNRDNIMEMEPEPKEVLTELLLLIDRYNLYGKVAFPKYHKSQDIPILYRIAAKSQGVFVNPALTEPFGLTLLESAASGLPIVATEDGGPIDIIKYCENGLLIDPYDSEQMAEKILKAITNPKQWQAWAKNGITGVNKHYSWQSHVKSYLTEVEQMLTRAAAPQAIETTSKKRPLATVDRVLACEADDVLVGDAVNLQELLRRLKTVRGQVGLCIATGRGLKSTIEILEKWKIPTPDVLITSVGSGLYYGPEITEDASWANHINYRWQPEEVKYLLSRVPGLNLQPKEHQSRRKISYYVDEKKAPPIKDLARRLRKHNLEVNLIYSHQMYLDVLPIRASKGAALRFFAVKWGLPVQNLLVCGSSGNDEEMLMGDTLGVIVGNHSSELERLRGAPQIYFAEGKHALGVIQGIEHYGFF